MNERYLSKVEHFLILNAKSRPSVGAILITRLNALLLRLRKKRSVSTIPCLIEPASLQLASRKILAERNFPAQLYNETTIE